MAMKPIPKDNKAPEPPKSIFFIFFVFCNLFGIWVLGFGYLLPVFAQQSDQVGITVSPITDEFTIKPGQVISREILVVNPTGKVATLYPVALDFNTDNDNGLPVFFPNENVNRGYSLSNWISFDRQFIRIADNEEEKVAVTISAPEDAEPGGHYGAVLFSTKKPELTETGKAKIGVVGLVGTLYLASVPGKIVDRLEIDSFSLPSIAFAPPIASKISFNNSGNIHQKPTGEITVKNWSGNQTTILGINEGKGNVLPNSRRSFEQSWNFPSLTSFGYYTYTATITYGENLNILTATKKIFVLPYWVIILLLVVFMGVFYKITRQKKSSPPIGRASPNKRLIQ